MEFFRIDDKNFVRTVTINNPRKKNALNKKAYFALGEILDAAGKDDKVKALVLTGYGDFFSSGNDLTQAMDSTPGDEGFDMKKHFEPLNKMITSFIRFPKLLIALVNGPAVGIGATILPLCDVVYASKTAYFYTPFTALGLCAEGCSSITFPKILGTSKASEMLSLNHKLTAHEAHQFGFVSSVFDSDKEVWSKLEQIGKLPMGSIIANKSLLRKFTIAELEAANENEISHLVERMGSEEAFEAMMNFQMSRKSKV